MKIAIWWNIPCKSIVPIARELANIQNTEVTFISQSGLSESRKKLGWRLPDFGKAEYLVLTEDNWDEEVERLLLHNYDIHIFNGVYIFPKVRYALDFARKNDIPFGVISEAYHNPYIGYKKILKIVFTRVITPFRVFPRIVKAKFVLSASGNNMQPFLNLGWREEQFFPFGYFPENTDLKIGDKKRNSTPNLLCTGYITKNKGHHILLHALSKLKMDGIAFKCTITGFGPEEKNVKQLVRNLNLNEYVNIVGVVSDSQLNEIKAKTDLLIAPGLEEPWGIRVNESLLAHTPVVVSDKIGASELILTSGAGRVFKSGSVDSLVQELTEQLAKNELIKAKKNAKEFSSSITPNTAAKYLYDVVLFSLQNIEKRPYPNWLAKK
jgi:glycosyltransferase involved in cell wall biosynthesis